MMWSFSKNISLKSRRINDLSCFYLWTLMVHIA
nr:MAG TPA: hypothetical protein [Caudoviricetes sp.]